MNKKQKAGSKVILLKAPISEIFFSYQGEGIYVGQPQIFIRFAGCNLRCGYCDTVQSQMLSEHQEYLGVNEIVKAAAKIARANNLFGRGVPPPTISITGGEPLLYPGFLSALLAELMKNKFNVYLETNGTLPDAFSAVKDWVNTVAMDIKLPSDCGGAFWKDHLKFLKIAKDRAFIKIVLTEHTTTGEIAKALKLVASVSSCIPFVLQPCTQVSKCLPPAPSEVFKWAALARKKLHSVHVLPQMHKIWKIK